MLAIELFEPILGEVQRNLDHATKMIASLNPGDIDILVLPEMAFTGYVFTSKDHIYPYLEDAEEGPSVKWAKTQAVRLNAHVQVGYPEKRIVNKDGQPQELFYNSLCFVSPQGKVLVTYAKHFLYYTDENWAEEGPGFHSIPINGLGQVGFGICMDVNPRRFAAPFSKFEFSNFHLEQKSDLVLCSMAWNAGDKTSLKTTRAQVTSSILGIMEGASDAITDQLQNGSDSDWEDDEEEAALELQCDSIQYWIVRMGPYYNGCPQPPQETIIAIANRIGKEEGNMFVGSSCVIKLSANGPEVIETLPSNKEGLLIAEV